LNERKSFAQALHDFATAPLGIVYFLLTPQEQERKIPATFPHVSGQRNARAITAGEIRATKSQGGKACNICQVGPCNASIQSARLAATGCELLTQGENAAAIAAHRSEMSRLRWARVCGCVHVRWGATARADLPAASGSFRERSQGRSSRLCRGELSPPHFLQSNQHHGLQPAAFQPRKH
jgi:hypothetical protein